MVHISDDGRVVIGFILLYWGVVLAFARNSFKMMDQFVKRNRIKHDELD